MIWNGAGLFWQRIFDFGSNSAGPGNQGTGTQWLFLTPQGGAAPGTLLVSMLGANGNWLGRSQFLPDAKFAGTYEEFRIYTAARTQAQIMLSLAAGPNGLPAQ